MSGQDCTLLSVFAAFQLDKLHSSLNSIPPYAAAITFELYSRHNGSDDALTVPATDYYVLMSYQRTAKEGFVPLGIPGCSARPCGGLF